MASVQQVYNFTKMQTNTIFHDKVYTCSQKKRKLCSKSMLFSFLITNFSQGHRTTGTQDTFEMSHRPPGERRQRIVIRYRPRIPRPHRKLISNLKVPRQLWENIFPCLMTRYYMLLSRYREAARLQQKTLDHARLVECKTTVGLTSITQLQRSH